MSGATVTTRLPDVVSPWGKPTFYYDNDLSSGTFTTTFDTTTRPIENIITRLESAPWISTAEDPIIYWDYGAGLEYTADYIAFNGHNFYEVGATVTFSYSDDDITYTPLVTTYGPTSDKTFAVEFTSTTARYWKLELAQTTATGSLLTRILNCLWGEKVELEWSTVDFDPTESSLDDTVNVSQTGVLLGIHRKQRKQMFRFTIGDVDAALYTKINTWFETVEDEPFFICWNYDDNPTDCFYMRSDNAELNAPYLDGKSDKLRSVSFNLVGRGHIWQ